MPTVVHFLQKKETTLLTNIQLWFRAFSFGSSKPWGINLQSCQRVLNTRNYAWPSRKDQRKIRPTSTLFKGRRCICPSHSGYGLNWVCLYKVGSSFASDWNAGGLSQRKVLHKEIRCPENELQLAWQIWYFILPMLQFNTG